jgi:hypothetical protein
MQLFDFNFFDNYGYIHTWFFEYLKNIVIVTRPQVPS